MQDELRIAWQYRRYLSEQKALEDRRIRQQELTSHSWAPASSFQHSSQGEITNFLSKLLVYCVVFVPACFNP